MALITRDAVLSKLVARGLIPADYEHSQNYYSRYGQFITNNIVIQEDSQEDSQDVLPRWQEPIPGLHPSEGGFAPGVSQHHDGHKRWYRNDSSIVEIHLADGIEWHMSRVLVGQPCWPSGSGIAFAATLETTMNNLGMELTVLDDPTTMLCICKPIDHMPFPVFRKTFRYWLICNTTDIGGMTPAIKPGVLPVGLNDKPHPIFFDLTFDASLPKVRLGLNNETCNEAWDSCANSHEWITRETFEILWHQYRSEI